MASLFSRLMAKTVDAQFRRDPTGRLVFVPFGPKNEAYFVDSKPDEEKIRAFVKMYRSFSSLLAVLIYPCAYVPGIILEDYGGVSPRPHRLAIAIGIPAFFWLVLVALAVMLWLVYRATVPELTSSLSEVSPDLISQLSVISPRPRSEQRVVLVCLFAGIALLALGIVGATSYSRGKPPCPPDSTSTSR
jgi:hypothetical protein